MRDTPGDALPTRSLSSAALRRWPLVLLLVGTGLLAAFLLYTRQPPVYESRAQVQVVRNRGEELSPSDYRMVMVEDYIVTQVVRFRSEGLLEFTARKLNPQALHTPLPEDDYPRAVAIGTMLTVARDRDTAGTGAATSSIINLSIRGNDPGDTKLILDTLLAANEEMLKTVYKTETDRSIERLEADQKSKEESIRQKSDDIATNDRSRVNITPENLTAVSNRISLTNDRLNALKLELIDLEDQLKLIANTGKNRRDRMATFVLLGGQKRSNQPLDASAPENMLLVLNAQRQERGDKLGKDHPEIKQLDAQIEYYKKLLANQNPDDPAGELDELAVLERRLEQRKRTAELQKRELSAILAHDVKLAQEASPFVTNINRLTELLAADAKSLANIKDELARLKRTNPSRGFEVRVLTAPRTGTRVGPNLVLWLFGGAVVGLGLGLGLAVFAEFSDKSFRSPGEIRQRLGVPIYGHIPSLRTKLKPDVDPIPALDPTLMVALRPKSIEAEAYRGVRAQLLVATANRSHQVIQVTSPNPGDGKSTLAANLAISLAQAGKRVILLDCDFRKPRVHKLFQLPKPEIGLASVTEREADLPEALRRDVLPNLDLLPCGPRPRNPAELLTSLSFQDVLTQLKSDYDYVIVDTPPLLAVSDPRVVAQRVDGVLLVFQMTTRARPQAERARELLVDMGANLMGVVVNSSRLSGGEYGYGYSYTYAADYEYAEQYADDPDAR